MAGKLRHTLRGRAGLALVWALTLVLVAGSSAIAARMITGAQIKNGTLTLKDFRKSERKKLRGPRGLRGAQGPAGAAGAAGATGPAGPAATGAGMSMGRVGQLWLDASATQYASPLGSSDATNPAVGFASQRELIVPAGGPTLISDLSVQLRSQGQNPQPEPPGTGNARAATIIVDGAPTAVTCAVVDLATTCESPAGASALVGPGQSIVLRIQTVDGEPQAEGIGGSNLLFAYRTRPG